MRTIKGLIRTIFVKKNLLEKPLIWKRTKQPLLFPAYEALYDDRKFYIRVNDFPNEHLYTLMEGTKELKSFDDWPETWKRD